ncbi:MAG: hypothetical protein HY841_00970 [Bacteroidetes bacterium]|nr:hypothetical protein [Bacteroidota bacterium]
MAKIKSFPEFLIGLEVAKDEHKKRFKYLLEYDSSKAPQNLYAVEISFEEGDTLLEHISLKKFTSTNNRYVKHPEQTHIPIKAHYHVYPPNSTSKELYAVNLIDGTAHHRANRGYVVPSKEADELRGMGVNLKPGNVLESIEVLCAKDTQIILESVQNPKVSVFLIFEE